MFKVIIFQWISFICKIAWNHHVIRVRIKKNDRFPLNHVTYSGVHKPAPAYRQVCVFTNCATEVALRFTDEHCSLGAPRNPRTSRHRRQQRRFQWCPFQRMAVLNPSRVRIKWITQYWISIIYKISLNSQSILSATINSASNIAYFTSDDLLTIARPIMLIMLMTILKKII